MNGKPLLKTLIFHLSKLGGSTLFIGERLCKLQIEQLLSLVAHQV